MTVYDINMPTLRHSKTINLCFVSNAEFSRSSSFMLSNPEQSATEEAANLKVSAFFFFSFSKLLSLLLCLFCIFDVWKKGITAFSHVHLSPEIELDAS